jgi:hypothetical protein
MEVHHANIELCICILLVGSQPEPLHSFLLINWKPMSRRRLQYYGRVFV